MSSDFAPDLRSELHRLRAAFADKEKELANYDELLTWVKAEQQKLLLPEFNT